jgi:hypothetical protein
VHLQESSSSEETLEETKLAFERVASSYGVKIQRYHLDNGRFADNAWMQYSARNNQISTMCGVNAHHQNGKGERRIRQLQDITRTSLIQASTMWPDAINVHLWPYALRKASDDLNQISHPNIRESPLQIFSRVAVHDNITNNHVFGCPVYVLQRPLQTGFKIPKWNPRATMGIYLVRSPIHVSSLGLVLSLKTGLVSPSFHNKYDDLFVTINDSFGKYIPKSNWQIKWGFRNEPTDPLLLLTPNLLEGASEQEGNDVGHEISNGNQQEIINDVIHEIPHQIEEGGAPEQHDNQDHLPNIHQEEGNILNPGEITTRSGRVSRMPLRYQDYVMYNALSTHEPSDIEEAYSASSDPDTMYYHEILREPDKDKFVEAMIKEIQQHNERDNWRVVPRNQIPPHPLLKSFLAYGQCVERVT